MNEMPALVISLDFELHWGVRDIHTTSSGYMRNIRGARTAIPRLLDLFREFGISATWSTVGFLFAESREELESFHPTRRPAYLDSRLDPYQERIGRDESDDPLHFAPSLIRLIADTPGQEIGTHTYSHYYCLEAGAEEESFRADLGSAIAIARSKGVEIRSLVLPRNQWSARYASVLTSAGIECYRGNQPGWMYAAAAFTSESQAQRLGRLVDTVVPVTPWRGMRWRDMPKAPSLCNVGATCFLRPVGGWPRGINELRLQRIRRGLTQAARENRVFHLWWHPHNFGSETSENLDFLRRILTHFARMSAEHGMRSLSMLDASRHAQRLCPVGTVG